VSEEYWKFIEYDWIIRYRSSIMSISSPIITPECEFIIETSLLFQLENKFSIILVKTKWEYFSED